MVRPVVVLQLLLVLALEIFLAVVVAVPRRRVAIALVRSAVLGQIIRARKRLVAVIANVGSLLSMGAHMSRAR